MSTSFNVIDVTGKGVKEVFEVEDSGHVGCDLGYWVTGPSCFKRMQCLHLQESSWTASA